MGQEQDTASTPAKTYNLRGAVNNVVARVDVKDRPYATFDLARTNGKTVHCVVFAEHIETVKSAVMAAEGKPVRLFGRFDKRTYEVEGQTKTSMRFRTLWAGQPKAKAAKSDEGQDVGF